LESRKSEKFTFSFEADTLETLLRKLLRYLGVKNFAIQFVDARLTRIVVLPESVSDITISENLQTDRWNPPESISVAQIMSVVEFSQAQTLDLTAGDIIIEYDGVRISSAQQLVEEVEKKAENSQVDMIVIREKNSMRLILAGGTIGVRIRTKNISYEEIDVVY
jgi:membrane-associated protease RseP (regulator of RpoE activity)